MDFENIPMRNLYDSGSINYLEQLNSFCSLFFLLLNNTLEQ